MKRAEYFVLENLPRGASRVQKEKLISNDVDDMSLFDASTTRGDVMIALDSLNEQQFIVLFRDGTVAMTAHGESMTT